MFREGGWVMNGVAGQRLPILIIAKTEDPVGGETITAGRREILDPGEERVHRDIGHWLTQTLDH
jgi:hypothetical protein